MMNTVLAGLARFLLTEEEGLTTLEYALLLAFLTLASVAAWQTFGQSNFNTADGSVNRFPGGAP